MSSDTKMWKSFDACAKYLRSHELLESYPHIKVKASVGQGNWARVPWIAFLDDRETESTQKGVYGVILFRQDMSGMYVTFNQGVTEPIQMHGAIEGKKRLQTLAASLRHGDDSA